MATPSRRSSRKASASANRSIRGQSAAVNPPSRTPSKAKKPTPKDEVIGQRISAYWPRDRKYYPCRVIDYDPESALHKVCYDEDDSVEFINLAKRKFKDLPPSDEEKQPGSLIGKKIEIVVDDIKSPDGPADDFRAIVLRPIQQEKDDDDDDGDDDDHDDENNEAEDPGTYQVLYLVKDYIATVDLKNQKYTILDMITNEPVKEVNSEDTNEEKSSKSDEKNPSKPDESSKDQDAEDKSDGVTGATSRNASKEMADDVVVNDEPPLVEQERTEKESNVVEIVKESSDVAMRDMTRKDAGEHITSHKPTDEAEEQPKTTPMEVEPAMAAEETAKAKDETNGAPAPNSSTPTEPQPLTKENLDKLDEGNSDKTANGNGIVDEDTKTVSDDNQNDNCLAGSSERIAEPKKLEKKFIMHKVAGTDETTERVAFVEAYLSSGNHFVVYHDEKGGQSQTVLTKDNCRELTKEEILKLGNGKVSHELETPVESTPQKGAKRKATPNGKGSSTKRRRASTGPTLPPPGMEIVGKCVTVTWPNNGKRYKCLVIGCQVDEKKTTHKVYYLEDDTTETMDLTSRNWTLGDGGKLPWNSGGLVGKRLYVYWEGEYEDEATQKLAIDKFGEGQTKIAYEAFVVKFLGPHKYRLLYTVDDNLEDRQLEDDGDDWNIADEGMADVDGLPIVAWTGPADDEEE